MVTKEESKKLLDEAQDCLNQLIGKQYLPLVEKQMLAQRISQLVKVATNIDLVVNPMSGSMAGKMVRRSVTANGG